MPRVRLSDNVVHRSFGTETVLLHLDTGQYHGLRGSGGRMLEVLSETPDIDAAAKRVATEFGQPVETVRADMDELCRALEQRRLVVIEEEA